MTASPHPRLLHSAALVAALTMSLGACAQSARQASLARGDVPPAPAGTLAVEMRGRAHAWQYRFPGADGQLGSVDDLFGSGDLYLPANSAIDLQLRSDDYAYLVSIPALDVRQIALPDMTFSVPLHTGRAGVFELRGSEQLCSLAHPELRVRLVVEPWPQAAARLSRWPGGQVPTVSLD